MNISTEKLPTKSSNQSYEQRLSELVAQRPFILPIATLIGTAGSLTMFQSLIEQPLTNPSQAMWFWVCGSVFFGANFGLLSHLLHKEEIDTLKNSQDH